MHQQTPPRILTKSSVNILCYATSSVLIIFANLFRLQPYKNPSIFLFDHLYNFIISRLPLSSSFRAFRDRHLVFQLQALQSSDSPLDSAFGIVVWYNICNTQTFISNNILNIQFSKNRNLALFNSLNHSPYQQSLQIWQC